MNSRPAKCRAAVSLFPQLTIPGKHGTIDCIIWYNKLYYKATPHKARLAALHAICLLIFRHTAQKFLDIRLRSRQDSAREQRSVALGLIATDSMPAKFLCNLPKNPTAHLTHKLCAVLP